MISYTTGPYLGNAEAGLAASLLGLRASVVTGGALWLVVYCWPGGCRVQRWRGLCSLPPSWRRFTDAGTKTAAGMRQADLRV